MISIFCECKHPEGVKVNPHLAITLPELEKRRNAGQAIMSNPNESACSFSGNCIANFPIEFERSMSLNTIYERGLRSKSKIEQYGRKQFKNNNEQGSNV